MAMLKGSSLLRPARRCLASNPPPTHAVRPFRSTTRPHEETIPPESPRFIDIPEPPQQQSIYYKPIRGTLPVPREIFDPRKGGEARARPERLQAQLPNPKRAPRFDGAPESQVMFRERKARMTEQRKQNYREAFTGLLHRRKKQQHRTAQRAAKNQEERQRIRRQADVEGAPLTRPTLPEFMRPARGPIPPDPFAAERHAAGVARVQEREAARSEERKAALHTLYMHARNFITTEAQLNQTVEAAFGTSEQPHTWNSGVSIWHTGDPPKLKELANRARAAERIEDDDPRMNQPIMRERLSKLAEELTGGKM